MLTPNNTAKQNPRTDRSRHINCQWYFFVKHWWGGTWTNPDRIETDRQYLSQLGRLISTLTCLGVEVQWENPEAASSFSSCVKLLFGRVGGRQGQISPKQHIYGQATWAYSPAIFSVLHKYPRCGTATGWSICLNAQAHISQLSLPPSWVLTNPNNPSGRSESIHTEKILNVSDLRWVTSWRWCLSGGRHCLLEECFTTVQKYILSSAFICLSVQHASCMRRSRWRESCWLKQYSWLYCLTLSVSTVGGNHSQVMPGRDRNIHETDRGEENQQASWRSGVMKYVCQHDIAWSLTAPSFLSSLEFLTAKT